MILRPVLAVLLALLLLGPRQQPDPRGRYAAPASGKPLCTLQIHATGFRNNTGAAGTLVFASSSGWPENQSRALVWGGFPIVDREANPTFHVPPGRYAAVVIHDENSNMKLDRNFFGIPKEGFGFSNNPRVVFSAPSFQSATVPVTCPETKIEIQLIYK